MSLHTQPLEPIPDLTSRIAQASFPKGTLAMHLRDALGPVYEDADFAHLFPKRGRAAEPRGRRTRAGSYPFRLSACMRLARAAQRNNPLLPFEPRSALRAGIEGSLSEGIRSHSRRRARYRGQSKTQLQAQAIAAAINLVRIRQMLQRTQLGFSPRPKRPLSPFARLRPLLAA